MLGEADVDAASPAMVDLQYMEVDGEFSMAIFQHPDSRIRIGVDALGGGTLRLAMGVKSTVWDRIQRPITFRAGATVAGKTTWLHERTLDPRRKNADRAWVPAELALPLGTSAVVLETKGRRRRTAYAWAGWADPVVEMPNGSKPSAEVTRTGHPSVLIITADACRADMLGCYGARDVPTPNLDALAADGLVFDDARANSTTTVGSYATAWTGLHPAKHGMLSEWGTFPVDVPNVFSLARSAGFHTVFAASELETGSPEQGFGRPFDDVIPCTANPSQDGAVTTRQFLRWFDVRPDAPFVAWVGYYHTHPPLRLP